jgi:hypothetical protein
MVSGETPAALHALDLVRQSKWFTCEPWPDDEYRFTIKDEAPVQVHETLLRLILPNGVVVNVPPEDITDVVPVNENPIGYRRSETQCWVRRKRQSSILANESAASVTARWNAMRAALQK